MQRVSNLIGEKKDKNSWRSWLDEIDRIFSLVLIICARNFPFLTNISKKNPFPWHFFNGHGEFLFSFSPVTSVNHFVYHAISEFIS